jgi:hypothetical protein
MEIKMKKDQENYQITLKGLISTCPGLDEFQVKYIWDTIELYSRRHDVNAVLLRDGGRFVDIALPKKSK